MFISNYTGRDIDTAVGKVLDGKIGGMTEITYNELVELRNKSELIPGMQYRITDYMTTTSQENTKTADHQFDIIVTADSTNILNEKARAIQHEGDTYFANSNLAAWELWYSLDNDEERFSWARNPITYLDTDYDIKRDMIMVDTVAGKYVYFRYPDNDTDINHSACPCAWVTDTNCLDVTFKNAELHSLYDTIYTYTDRPSVGEIVTALGNSDCTIVDVSWTEGKGVIYRMIDEFGNDCPYDFKNIMFNCTDISSSDVANIDHFEYYYTFSKLNYNPWGLFDASVVTLVENNKLYNPMKTNIIKSLMYHGYKKDSYYCKYKLHRNILYDYNVSLSDSTCENNIIGIKCKDIIITNNAAHSGETNQNFYKPSNNNIGQGCENIKISNGGSNNTFINCKNLTITDAHNFYINSKKVKITYE